MDRETDPKKSSSTDEQADLGATMAVPTQDASTVASYPYRTGDLVLPGYRLLKRLGQGGFGEVWRATAPGGMGVAIKVLANLDRREGGREYRALQTVKDIRHPHIVPIFGVWLKAGNGRVLDEKEIADVEKQLLQGGDADAVRTAESTAMMEGRDADLAGHELVIAMGLGDQTLHDRLRQTVGKDPENGLPWDRLLVWMRQAALAIDHFNRGGHRVGDVRGDVQHCDIKPQNILLVGEAVQVCDFGLARLQGEVRATNTNMASLAYAAPELLQPPHDPSPSTDQYSLAISCFEMHRGRLPFTDVRPVAILRAKLDGGLTFPGLSEAESAVLARATSFDPSDRFPTCSDFIDALEHAVKSGAAPAASQEAARLLCETGGSNRQTRAVLLAALTTCFLAAGAAAVWFGISWNGGREQPGPDVRPTANVSDEAIEQHRREAVRLEREGAFAAAGEAYAAAIIDDPDTLAATLWDLQTQASDAGRPEECIPLLTRLEGLYELEPPPSVKGIARWDVVNSLAWYLATVEPAVVGAASRSTALAEEAMTLAGSDETSRAQSLDTLAVALARDGRTEEALRRIDEAISLAKGIDDRATFERHRAAFASGKPWSDP